MSGERELVVIPATKKENPNDGYHQKRVVAYCRVSTDSEEQLTSYENQLAYYEEKIIKNPEWKFGGIFADEGITGTQVKNRTEFNNMIKQCQKGKIDLILTKSISRFARNTVDCLNYVRILKALGVTVIFEKENINTMSMESETLISLLASLAQAESESISGNVKWGVRKGFKQGKARIPYNTLLGYMKGEDGNPKIVLDEAETIEYIFESYLSGDSLKIIKNNLEMQKRKTKKGLCEWSVSTLQHILKNEKYVGDVLMQKTFTTDCISKKVKKNNGELPKYLIKNNHPAIIDRDVFNRVQKEIARRTSKRKVSSKSKTQLSKYSSKYALSELLICGKCGSPYKRVTWARNGEKKIVWRCITRLEHGKKYCAESPTIPESELHRIIVDAINEKLKNKESLLSVLQENADYVINGKGEDVENPFQVDYMIEAQELQLKQLIELSAKVSHEKRNKLYTQISKISKELKILKAKKVTDKLYKAKEACIVNIPEQIDWSNGGIIEFNDNIVRQIIECVRVIDVSKIEIIFKGGTV